MITQRLSDKALLEAVIMADNVSGSSRSRSKRRSRSNRKKSKKCSVNRDAATESVVIETVHAPVPSDRNDCDNKDSVETKDDCLITSDNYRVESPKTVQRSKATNVMVKSRSLDDDDQVKITEVTDVSDKDVSTSVAIVSEAESDVEWEVAEDMAVQNESTTRFGKLSVISLPLVEHTIEEIAHISPEDEKSLRDFLQGLNLVGSPEDSMKRIDKSAMENVKTKKAKKRQAIVEHFLPYYHNPRYLDVISEEGSDLSDRELHKDDAHKDITHNARPLIVNPYFIDDDIYETMIVKDGKFMTSNEEALLVGTKIIESIERDNIESLVELSVAECSSGAEVVYIEDSSESMTPSDVLEQEEALDADVEDEEESIDLDLPIEDSNIDIKDVDVTKEIIESVTSRMETEKTCDDQEPRVEESIAENGMNFLKKSIETELPIVQISDNHELNSSKNECTEGNETTMLKETIESMLLSEVNITDPKVNVTPDDNSCESRVMKTNPLSYETQQTVTTALYNEQNGSTHSEFLNKIIAALSIGNSEINSLLNDESYKNLPKEIKSTIKTVINSGLQGNLQEGNVEALRKLINKSPGMVDDEFNAEFKQFCDELNKNNDGLSRPESSNSDRSSRSTSQCTALYNPIHSSLTNIVAILQEGSEEKVNQPQTLRELCVQTLLKMPFGQEVIEELADVSLSIEEMTSNTHTRLNPLTPESTNSETLNNACDADSMDKRGEKWVGLPTEEDPSVLVCLSPSQKSHIETTRSIPKEADKLLDLHKKYLDRKSWHEDISVPTDFPISSLRISFDRDKNYNYYSSKTTESKRNSSYINYDNYSKQFTPKKEVEQPVLVKWTIDDSNINYNNYIKQVTHEVPIHVENKIHKPVNNLVYNGSDEDLSSKRLSARHLTEWVNLARSCSDISNAKATASPTKIRAPMTKFNSQRSFDGTFTEAKSEHTKRRYSLPHELYEKQMKYILNKEKEIQMEIDKLEREKSMIENEESFFETKNFASNYHISKKGDIAILDRPKSQIIVTSEVFRQKMYNEWLNKVAEREERKQQKLIKVSSVTGQDEKQQEVKERPISGIEDEFMVKVKERMTKLGLNEEKETAEEENNDGTEKNDADKEPVVVVNGDSLSNTNLLPKHLQEFVDYIRCTAQDDNGELNLSRCIKSVVWFTVMLIYDFLCSNIQRLFNK